MEIKFSAEEQAFHDEMDEFLQRELPENWADKPIAWPHDYAASGYQDEDDYQQEAQFIDKIVAKGWFSAFWDKGEEKPAYSNMEQAIFDERMSYYRAPRMGHIATGIVAPMLLRVGS